MGRRLYRGSLGILGGDLSQTGTRTRIRRCISGRRLSYMEGNKFMILPLRGVVDNSQNKCATRRSIALRYAMQQKPKARGE